MSLLDNLMRWVRVRGLREGAMQVGRVEGLPNDVRDEAQRPQDYGFAANPVEGQGLKLEIGGHTVIIRLDRLAERPQLAQYEVAVWHKEGHRITLKANGLVQMDCVRLVVNASAAVTLNSPQVTINASAAMTVNTPQVALNTPNVTATGAVQAAGVVTSAVDVLGGGKSLVGHTHGGVAPGAASTGAPN